MSQKPRVSIQREDDFQEVDALLNEALAALDESNARVASLLESEPAPSPVETGTGDDTDAAAAPAE